MGDATRKPIDRAKLKETLTAMKGGTWNELMEGKQAFHEITVADGHGRNWQYQLFFASDTLVFRTNQLEAMRAMLRRTLAAP